MKEEREDEKGKEVCKESESLLLCKLVFPRRKVPPSLTVTVVMDVMRLCPWAASPQCGNMQAIEGLENYFCQLVGCIYPGQVGRLLGCMPIASVFTWGWLGGGVLPKRGRKQQTSNTIHIHPPTPFSPPTCHSERKHEPQSGPAKEKFTEKHGCGGNGWRCCWREPLCARAKAWSIGMGLEPITSTLGGLRATIAPPDHEKLLILPGRAGVDPAERGWSWLGGQLAAPSALEVLSKFFHGTLRRFGCVPSSG